MDGENRVTLHEFQMPLKGEALVVKTTELDELLTCPETVKANMLPESSINLQYATRKRSALWPSASESAFNKAPPAQSEGPSEGAIVPIGTIQTT